MKKVNKKLLDEMGVSPEMYVDTPAFIYENYPKTLKSRMSHDLNEILDFIKKNKVALMRDWDAPEADGQGYIVRLTEL